MRSHSAGGDQPGDRVERDDPLDPLVAAVDGEGDPLLAHRQVGDLVAAFQLVGAQLDQPLVQRAHNAGAGARANRTSRRRPPVDSGGTGRSRRAVDFTCILGWV